MKILVCLSGASLINMGFRLIHEITKQTQIYAILSKNAKFVLEKEQSKFNDFSKTEFIDNVFKNKNVTFLDDEDLSQSVASGSFGIDKTIIAPCSINTLAKINAGIGDTLITRAANVALKEQKKLILGVREMPLSAISCEHLANLSRIGVVIAPPILAEYSGAKTIEDMQNFIIGRWLDLLEIRHDLYKKWS